EEVAGHHVVAVVAEEGPPGARAALGRGGQPLLAEDPLDRRPGDAVAELARLALDALGAPQAVIRRQLLDQRRSLRRQLRLGRDHPRLALPEQGHHVNNVASGLLDFGLSIGIARDGLRVNPGGAPTQRTLGTLPPDPAAYRAPRGGGDRATRGPGDSAGGTRGVCAGPAGRGEPR